MQAGFERTRMVRRTIRRHGKRRVVRRPVTVLAPTARVRSGRRVHVAGRLVNRDGQGVAGAEVRVYSSSPISAEQLVAVLRTDDEGRYRYTAAGSSNRTLRFAFAGSPLVLPTAARDHDDRASAQLAAGQPPARAQRSGGHVRRPARGRCRCRRAASSSSCRCGCRAAGRRSALHAPTRPGAGRCATASSARAAYSDTASAPDYRPRPATRSSRDARAR